MPYSREVLLQEAERLIARAAQRFEVQCEPGRSRYGGAGGARTAASPALSSCSHHNQGGACDHAGICACAWSFRFCKSRRGQES